MNKRQRMLWAIQVGFLIGSIAFASQWRESRGPMLVLVVIGWILCMAGIVAAFAQDLKGE